MKKLEFLKELKDALYFLLTKNEKYSFSSYQLPKNDDNFYKYTQDYLIQKLKYKNNYWFEIDGENFSIELNISKDIEIYFIKNEIPDYVKELSSSDFEILGAILLKKLLGSLMIEEKKVSRDDGIDFYGQFKSDGMAKEYTDFFQTDVWYIGQVKQYKQENSISTKYIRELIGTIELAKKGIWSNKIGYNNLNIEHYEGVIPIFLTSSRYSNDTISIAKKFNIKLLDDIDLIFWLTILYKGNLSDIKNDLKRLKDE